MNTPNKLTIIRMIFVPVFMAVYMIGTIPYANIWAAALFIVASLTDYLDGHLARKNDLVTNFGKFMDPLADKLLVTGALLCLLDRDIVAFWVVMIIISREFLVTGLRLIAASRGIVIAAGKLGKLKTVVQMIAIIAAIIFGKCIVVDILIYLSVFLTALSGAVYILQNRHVLKDA